MYGGMSLVANVSKSIVDREMKKERDNSTSEKSIFSLKRSKSKNGKKPEPTTQPDNSLLQQPPASAESSIRTSASSSNFNDQRSSSTSAMRSSASSANQRTMSNDSWTAPSAEYSATALSTNDYLAQMLGDLHVQHLEYIQEDNEENDLDDIVGLYGDEVDDKSNELGGSLSRKKTPYNSLISALNELITTERSYVQSLQTLYKTILLPLKEYGKKMISEKDYNLLASNLTEIIGVHETLLGGLEERFLTHPPPSIPPVTDLYLCTIPFLRTYVTYISNYSSALTLTSHLRATNEKFKALIESAEQSEDFKGLKFEAYLIMPVQRVPRYRLLLENVEKAIKTVVEDYVQSLSGEVDFGDVLHYSNGKLEVDLSRWTGKGGVIVKNVDGMDVTVDENEIIAIRDCVDKIRGVADGINESVRQHETRLRVLQIQASLSSIPNAFQLIQPNRQFIAEFRAYKVSRTGFEKRQLFLFNDILLISKPLGSSTSSHRKTRIFGSRSKDTEKFEYKNSIELIFTWIDANEEDDSRRESPYGIVGLGINSFTSDDGNPATPTSQASYGSGPISPAFELDEKERETKKYPVRLLTTSAAGDQTLTFFIVGASHKDKFVKLVAESIENARGSSAYLGKALDSLNRNSSQSNASPRRNPLWSSSPTSVSSTPSSPNPQIPYRSIRRGSDGSVLTAQSQAAYHRGISAHVQEHLRGRSNASLPNPSRSSIHRSKSVPNSPELPVDSNMQSYFDHIDELKLRERELQQLLSIQRQKELMQNSYPSNTPSIHNASSPSSFHYTPSESESTYTTSPRKNNRNIPSPELSSSYPLPYDSVPQRQQSQQHSHTSTSRGYGELVGEVPLGKKRSEKALADREKEKMVERLEVKSVMKSYGF